MNDLKNQAKEQTKKYNNVKRALFSLKEQANKEIKEANTDRTEYNKL